jgi:hypothetical protein
MTLPGLPPPSRATLPVPSGGATAARREGARRRRNAAGAGALGLALVLGATALIGGGEPLDRLQVALSPHREHATQADRLSGRVLDSAGQPVARVAVLRGDLSKVLTRTASDGGFSVPCSGDLVVAAYAPTVRGGAVRERSPGAGNYAWRHVRPTCGQPLDIVLPAGGVVVGRGRAGSDVRLERVKGGTTEVLPAGPVFVTRVLPDGTWRVEGLDTGRYRLPAGTLIDVREGATVTAP